MDQEDWDDEKEDTGPKNYPGISVAYHNPNLNNSQIHGLSSTSEDLERQADGKTLKIRIEYQLDIQKDKRNLHAHAYLVNDQNRVLRSDDIVDIHIVSSQKPMQNDIEIMQQYDPLWKGPFPLYLASFYNHVYKYPQKYTAQQKQALGGIAREILCQLAGILFRSGVIIYTPIFLHATGHMGKVKDELRDEWHTPLDQLVAYYKFTGFQIVEDKEWRQQDVVLMTSTLNTVVHACQRKT